MLTEIRQSVEDFKLKTSKMSPEDPKLKMMQKVLDGLAPVVNKDDCDLGELLTLASMAMETWLDTRYLEFFFKIKRHFIGLFSEFFLINEINNFLISYLNSAIF